MIEVRQTVVFRDWLAGLRDSVAERIIRKRIVRIEAGLFGDIKSIGEGVSEVRIDHGPGYRLYFCRRGTAIVILLCGGDKGSQARDIRSAQDMAKEV